MKLEVDRYGLVVVGLVVILAIVIFEVVTR